MRIPYSASPRPLVKARPKTARSGHFVIDRPFILDRKRDAAPESHWTEATCKEKRCPHYLNGWETIVGNPSVQADYIRHECGRRFTEEKEGDGLVKFMFPAGQECFRDHWKLKGVTEIFVGNGRQHERPKDWVEHHNEELHQIGRVKQRG